MPLTPPLRTMPMPNVIAPWGPAQQPLFGAPAGAVSANFGVGTLTATTVYLLPFVVWEPWTVRAVAVSNGATVNGSFDVAVYSNDGATKHVSTGAVTQTGTSVAQVTSVTATTLQPGRYWMAFGLSSATATYGRWALATNWFRSSGLQTHTVASSGAPLPATVTPAAPAAGTSVPYFTLLDRFDS